MEINLAHSTKKLSISDSIFSCDYNEALIHQVVTAYMAAARAGTKAQKTRAQVRGGGAKPFKQKGSGRARAGTIRSPLWRSGGVIFACTPRSFKQKVNRKMFQGAMRSILSELVRQERLIVVEDFVIDAPKTKTLLKKLLDMQVDVNNRERALIVTHELEENLYLAARNIFQIEVRDAATTLSDPVSLVKAEKIIMTEKALKELEESLQ